MSKQPPKTVPNRSPYHMKNNAPPIKNDAVKFTNRQPKSEGQSQRPTPQKTGGTPVNRGAAQIPKPKSQGQSQRPTPQKRGGGPTTGNQNRGAAPIPEISISTIRNRMTECISNLSPNAKKMWIAGIIGVIILIIIIIIVVSLHGQTEYYDLDASLKSIIWRQPSQKVGLTQSEKDYLLNLHNLYRQVAAQGKFDDKPKAANMEMMKWCDSCARDAQVWANNCGGPAHGNHENQGQNYAARYPYNGIFKSAFKGWMDKESKMWRWGTTGLGYFPAGAGHLSQILWAETNSVGCGFNSCEGRSRMMGRLVCNYKPAGNVNAHNTAMYLVGSPCSKCPTTKSKCINNALCAASWEKGPKYPIERSSGDSS